MPRVRDGAARQPSPKMARMPPTVVRRPRARGEGEGLVVVVGLAPLGVEGVDILGR